MLSQPPGNRKEMQIGNSFLSQEINRNLPAKGTLDPCQLSLTYFTSYPIVVTYLHLLSALESLAPLDLPSPKPF